MCSTEDVSRLFVNLAINEGQPITQLKLQKLVYIAHGFHLAIYKEPLVSENVEAWKFGPVFPSIYRTFSIFGDSPIDDPLLTIVLGDKKPKLTVEAEGIIRQVWAMMRKHDAFTLVNWTHSKDGPWYSHYEEDSRSVEIPNDDIEEYFRKFIKRDGQ